MIPIMVNTQVMNGCECALRRTMFYDLAVRTFDLTYMKSWLYKFWAFLGFRSSRLFDLRAVSAVAHIRKQHYDGVTSVAIEQIRGSENRSQDFDVHFNPVRKSDKERWVNVAVATLEESALPPVELIKIGSTYFVRDGHHRISAAKAFGQKEIDAIVTTWEMS